MSVLTRSSLEGSPLADLHVLAAELGLDGYRKLRKADLVQAILEGQPGGAPEEEPAAEASAPESDAPKRPARRRGGRTARRDADAEALGTDAPTYGDSDAEAEADPDVSAVVEERPARSRRSRGGRDRGERGGREDRGGDDRPARNGGREESDTSDDGAEVSGVVELLSNGSGFLRVSPPEPSDDDVYISAAQIRRCELVSGDKVAGPVRAPRRSERYPSLIRIDTINGRPADEVAEGTPWDELACSYPSERFALGSDDATLKAIEWLTPIGRGSRVTITGGPLAGKSEALRLLAGALSAQEDLEVSVVLVGTRPEELGALPEGVTAAASLPLGSSPDAQAQAVERVIETGKRVAARGGHAVVLIDSLALVPVATARKALGAARAIVDGGSLTVVATAPEPLGGETTIVALDVTLAATGRLPALDLVGSATLRPELLVGQAGAEAIASARAAALDA
jgi:transcription termination factor Rho